MIPKYLYSVDSCYTFDTLCYTSGFDVKSVANESSLIHLIFLSFLVKKVPEKLAYVKNIL